MRIPKYQVWHRKEKVMRPVESLIMTENDGLWINDYPDTGNCDLREHTGLKDKNGKEIYEGDMVDIIYCFYLSIPTKIKGKVIFYQGGFFVEESSKLYPFQYIKTEEFEIIGNIYENPELLK